MRLADLPSFDVWRFAPDRIRRSYAAKLGVSFLAVIVVIGAIGGAIYLQANAELREDTNRELTTSTTLQAETLSRWIDRMKEETRLLSRSTTIRSRDTDRIRGFLVNEIDEEGRLPPEVAAVHYLDTSEFVIRTSTADPFVGVSPREEGVPWAQGSLAFEGADDTVVKGPFREPVNNQPVIAVISPVPGQDDRALVMMVNLRKRIESMPRPLEADSFTKVVNSRGTVVMSHRTDQMLTQNMGPADEQAVESEAVNRGLEGEVGTASMAMHGETMLMGYAPVEGTDWVVMAHVPKRSAFALSRLISRDLLLLLLASVLGLGLIGATVGRSTADALQTLSAKAAAIADGDLEAEIPHSRREDELGRLYGSFGEMQDQLGDLLDDVEAERERAEAARAEAEAFTEHLEATAEEYGEVMAAVADGDLTERMDPDDESEAMREIAASFNSMLEAWTTTVAQVAEFGDEVTASSEKFTTAADEVETASADVSESIQEISEGANRQTESLKDISETVNHLSATIEEVASSADEVAATSRRAAETGEEGREAAEDAVAAMNEIEATTEETVSEVEALDEEMAKIGEIVDVITEIADQTDILALNASIEAARAGEAGDGFAVVADEVKSLAEETKDATDEIEAVLDTIRSRTENTVEGMEEMRTNVSAGLDTVERAIDALEEISDHVEDANRGIQEISTATDDQAESAQEIVPMVEDVAEISEETRDGAEDVAAASEEQAASTAEVARQARELETKAQALMDLLDEFELDEVTEQPDVDPGATAGTAQTDGGPADG